MIRVILMLPTGHAPGARHTVVPEPRHKCMELDTPRLANPVSDPVSCKAILQGELAVPCKDELLGIGPVDPFGYG